jgi:hypothetical protein
MRFARLLGRARHELSLETIGAEAHARWSLTSRDFSAANYLLEQVVSNLNRAEEIERTRLHRRRF